MIKDILYNGVKGAFTRLVRLIVYIIIVLIITYVIGLISSRKASALVYKGTIDTPYTTQVITEGTITAGTRQISIPYELQTPISPNADLIGFQIVNFGIRPYGISSTTICSPSQSNNLVTYTCSNNVDFDNYFVESPYFTFYGYITYTDETIGRCYSSTEYNDYLLCPVFKSTPIKKITIRINTVESLANLMYHLNLSMSNALFNYESTEIVNSNGVIVNNQTTIIQEQQQQNQWAQSNTVSGAESSAQSGISTLQTTLNNKMSSVNGLTQVVLAPITMFTNLANNTCTPIRLTAPFVNTTFELPCMSGIYNQYFGIIITLFATVIGGITGYWLCINIAKLIKELVDCDNDRIEVIDL